jgi:hypothetical protein
MPHQISKDSLYVTGAARFSYLIYLAIKDRGLVKEEVEHSRFIAFQRGQLAHMGDRNWSAVALCVVKKPAEKMIAISEDGEVFTYVAGKAKDEAIKPAPVVLRAIGVVDGLAIACGMKRQVYRRVRENSWLAMHAPAPPPGENAGFEAIAGFSGDEIYAVGWNGEIWEWNGSKWLNRTSPTNLILTGVCCAGDDKVYVCGQNGTLLQGRHDLWDVIDLEGMADDLWDVHWFNDTLYLATMTTLYTYTSAGLAPVDFGDDEPETCYRLTDAEGVLWSVGSDDVFSFDGAVWTRVD